MKLRLFVRFRCTHILSFSFSPSLSANLFKFYLIINFNWNLYKSRRSTEIRFSRVAQTFYGIKFAHERSGAGIAERLVITCRLIFSTRLLAMQRSRRRGTARARRS